MTTTTLANISVYPIKSCAGIDLSTSWVEELGLAFDRRFVVSDMNGQFITARTTPKLCLIETALTPTGLVLHAPDMPILTLNYSHFSKNYQHVNVWKDEIGAQHCHETYDQWFSRYLQKPCQLFFFGEDSRRYVKNKHSQVAFADGYPLLLISQASLANLNQQLDSRNQVTMSQFRPNIVVDGCDAFAEDQWQHIRIGEVEFELTKPCSRCTFTTINPATAEKHPHQEPLTTLKRLRQVASGDVMFGQNLVALNQGKIKQGDTVEVIATKSPPVFTVKKANGHADKTTNTPATKIVKNPVLDFSSWGTSFKGNNKESILDQGENAGLLLPYSCRAGMCGRCKIKLESGDVKQVATDGLSEEDKKAGYVLACSSIPQSNVVVKKPPRPSHREN